MERRTVRNILIFILVSLSCGWFGLLVDEFMNAQSGSEETLGMGLWLVLPLIVTILLRIFAGDGWHDIGLKLNIKGNIKWYITSLIIFPLVTGVTLLLGKMFNLIDFSNFRMSEYLTGFIGFLFINLIKNFFEESVWRGYLTAKLLKTKIKDIWLYLIVGVVWGAWHLPYYLYFLPQSDITQVLPVGRFVFALIAIITMICWSIMFVELYRITKSIWPVVLLHMIEDSVINHLVIDGHISILSGNELIISPIAGIITTALYVVVGLLLRKYRIQKENE